MEYPKRKPLRLKDYDYSKNGYYFVTICTKDRANILSEIKCNVGADGSVRPNITLTPIGNIVDRCWNNINHRYENVKTEQYVIMPDHLHGIIRIEETDHTGGQSRPPLPKIVQGFKSITTRMCFDLGYKQIWQRSFHDHIIRNAEDYAEHLKYIEENPLKRLEQK